MVQVTSYAVRKRKDGSQFITLELTGSLELIQSQNGGYYATVRKCNIPSTFDENIAKGLVGQRLDGEIVRVAVDPYDFVNKRTGELMTLQHSYSYRPAGSIELLGETKIQEVQTDLV